MSDIRTQQSQDWVKLLHGEGEPVTMDVLHRRQRLQNLALKRIPQTTVEEFIEYFKDRDYKIMVRRSYHEAYRNTKSGHSIGIRWSDSRIFVYDNKGGEVELSDRIQTYINAVVSMDQVADYAVFGGWE